MPSNFIITIAGAPGAKYRVVKVTEQLLGDKPVLSRLETEWTDLSGGQEVCFAPSDEGQLVEAVGCTVNVHRPSLGK